MNEDKNSQPNQQAPQLKPFENSSNEENIKPAEPDFNYIDAHTTMPPSPQKSKRSIIFIGLLSFIGVLLMSLIIALAITSSNQKSDKSERSQFNGESIIAGIPEDWEDIDPGYGYKLKMPKGWEVNPQDQTTSSGLQEDLSELVPQQDEAEATFDDEGNEIQPVTPTKLDFKFFAGSQKFSDESGGDQAAFEKSITELDDNEYRKIQGAQGLKREDIKISSARVRVNDVDWVRVDIETPKKLTRTLYQWKDNRAASVSITYNGIDKNKFNEYVKTYLEPSAASVEFDQSEE